MTADLDTPAVSTGTLPLRRGARPAVTVLAPLISPQECTDLERPEAATVEVFDAVTRGSGGGRHQLLPVRMRTSCWSTTPRGRWRRYLSFVRSSTRSGRVVAR